MKILKKKNLNKKTDLAFGMWKDRKDMKDVKVVIDRLRALRAPRQ